MEAIILDFKSKSEEINEYFSFIERTTHLRSFSNDENMIQVSQTVHNVLKANLFLLLYNLIESSFKNALEKVCIQISDDKVEYKNVIPELKKMWIEKKYNNFNKFTLPNNVKRNEFIMDKIDNIAEDIIEIQFYSDNEKKNNNSISGNLDAREIRNINETYGVQVDTASNIDTQPLLTVKIKRNALAHGDETFSTCGGGYLISELDELKNQSLDYMEYILIHMKSFLNDKKYKIAKESTFKWEVSTNLKPFDLHLKLSIKSGTL